MITARSGRVDLARVLPGSALSAAPSDGRPGAGAEEEEDGPVEVETILTEAEMQELERSNIVRALEAASWQVSGEDGAARLLGIPPSTLSSRMRSLEIDRPD